MFMLPYDSENQESNQLLVRTDSTLFFAVFAHFLDRRSRRIEFERRITPKKSSGIISNLENRPRYKRLF